MTQKDEDEIFDRVDSPSNQLFVDRMDIITFAVDAIVNAANNILKVNTRICRGSNALFGTKNRFVFHRHAG